jgi:hypothetical protein
VEKETGGSGVDRVDEAEGRDGQFDIKLDQDFKPLVMTHGALRTPAVDYLMTSLLTTQRDYARKIRIQSGLPETIPRAGGPARRAQGRRIAQARDRAV